MSTIAELAERQLSAYNAHDLDAFCACYHPEVQMFEGEELGLTGIAAFRERYADMFERGGFGATVPERIHHGEHCVDLEHYWRQAPGAERSEGTCLVRYSLRDQQIGTVQFLG